VRTLSAVNRPASAPPPCRPYQQRTTTTSHEPIF
jgi:hypothetical protein